ncbi:LuxR C-terminal-related transcriptional regulator [Actinoplanes sp. NPDC024001]|uniref:LuxR C-terminal-related transcriptional regulator n=1 Tax=Actinoplanes sp. NPDC024001 TaxID=3154598 RepID=UPI0033F2FFCE
MSPAARMFRFDEAVADVYGDLRLAAVLRRLLRHTGRLTGSPAGSISLVDADRGRYIKAAEFGVSCRLGHEFPLDEGATGRAFAGRRPVVIGDYGQLRAGHLAAAHPARRGPAAAVPIWWRGDVIAVNVAFSPSAGALSARGVDELEALSQSAAAAIVESGRHDPSLAALIKRRFANTVVTEAGVIRPVTPQVARLATDLVAHASRAAPRQRLDVAIVYRQDGLRVLLQEEAAEPGTWNQLPRQDQAAEPAAWNQQGQATEPAARSQQEQTTEPAARSRQEQTTEPAGWDRLPRIEGADITVEQVRGWGVLVRADLPYAAPAPFTPREAEVLELLRRGLTYREMAGRLNLSAKTIEKHVSAIMRKTGTSNRTAAVVTAMDNDWVGVLPHTAEHQHGS